MWLLKLAWKNMWRNKNRTVITVVAVAFAVILSIVTSSLQDGVFGNLVKNVVSFYSGYIQIHKQGYWEERTLENSFSESAGMEQQILRDQNIAAVAPRLESFALASSDDLTKGCMVVGISPVKENEITALQNKVVGGEYLMENDNQVLLAQGLAGRLKLELHDTVVLIGQGYHAAMAAGKFRIKGIVKFGSPELNDQALFLALPTMQELFGAEDRLSSYVLALDDLSLLDPTAQVIRSNLGSDFETMTWEEMMPEVIQHIRIDKGSMYIIQGILYLLVCFGIMGTLLMMMVERKYETGMLVAIGMKKGQLMKLLMLESVITVLSGCVVGILVSIPLVYYLYLHPIRIKGDMAKVFEDFGFEPIFPSSTDFHLFLNQGLVVLSLGLLLALYPIMKIARLNPVNAMKK